MRIEYTTASIFSGGQASFVPVLWVNGYNTPLSVPGSFPRQEWALTEAKKQAYGLTATYPGAEVREVAPWPELLAKHPYQGSGEAVPSGSPPEDPMSKHPPSREARDLVALERKVLQDSLLARLRGLEGYAIESALMWYLQQPCRVSDLETLQRLIAQAELET